MYQTNIILPAYSRGLHLITHYIIDAMKGHARGAGLVHLFIQHTSAGLMINEAADPNVLIDLERALDLLAPEDRAYVHNEEGPDDMPAHIKAMLTQTALSIPYHEGKLLLGTWQGIFLCEYRNHARARKLILSIAD